MTQFVEANGMTVGYDVHGEGPPLILLHGAASSGREDWAAQVPLFSKTFTLYIPDARGHATTAWDVRRGFSLELLVEDLEAFADALGLDTFDLAGFSMGAMTALAFATRHPGRLRRLDRCRNLHPARTAGQAWPARSWIRTGDHRRVR